jgi:hypothetical protein
MELGNLAQWVGAIATSTAVFIALFKETLLLWWRRPILTATIKLEPPDCHKVPFHAGPVSGDCYYFRLYISNSGRSRAEQVQVYASKLFRKLADESFHEEKNFSPMNLRWSHSHEIYAEGISADMGKHCDLAHVIDPALRRKLGGAEETIPLTEGTIFSLDLEVKPGSRGHLVKPGTYRLELRIAAANARPVTKYLEFTCTGTWFNNEQDMFRDGIRLNLV